MKYGKERASYFEAELSRFERRGYKGTVNSSVQAMHCTLFVQTLNAVYSFDDADAMVSRSLAADVVTGSSSTSSTFPRTFFPKTAFHGGITIETFPVAFA